MWQSAVHSWEWAVACWGSRRAAPCAQRKVLKRCSRRGWTLRRRRLAHLLQPSDAAEFQVNVSITCHAKHATLSAGDAGKAGGSGMRPRKSTQIHSGASALHALRLGTKLHLNVLLDGARCGRAPVDGERAASLGKMALSCLGRSLVDQRAACMAPENTAARRTAESSFIEPISRPRFRALFYQGVIRSKSRSRPS